MLTDEKREALKAQEHMAQALSCINRLQDEVLTPKKYYQEMERLRKHAQLAASRFGSFVARHVDVFERNAYDREKYPQFYANQQSI